MRTAAGYTLRRTARKFSIRYAGRDINPRSGRDCVSSDHSDPNANCGTSSHSRNDSDSDSRNLADRNSPCDPGNDSDSNSRNHADRNSRCDPGNDSDGVVIRSDARSDSGNNSARSRNNSGCRCAVAQFFSAGRRLRESPDLKQSICQRIFGELRRLYQRLQNRLSGDEARRHDKVPVRDSTRPRTSNEK